MGKRLVTIATFDQAAQAHLAKNVLDEVGIQATISDETLVTMDWLLSNAVGGIKVQVWEEDADRAVVVLEQKFGEHGEGLGAIPPEELAKIAEAEAREDAEPESEPATQVAATTTPEIPLEDEPPSPPLSERQQYARRAFLAAVFGLFVPPFLFYAVYLTQVAAFGEGDLGPQHRWKVWTAFGLTAFGLLTWSMWLVLAPYAFLQLF